MFKDLPGNDTKKRKKKQSVKHSRDRIFSQSSTSSRPSRMSFMAAYANEIFKALESREIARVLERIDGKEVDVTPKPITLLSHMDRFETLIERLRHEALLVRRSSYTSLRSTALPSSGRIGGMGAFRISMDDILKGIGSTHLTFHEEGSFGSLTLPPPMEHTKHRLPFIKIVLRRTDDIVLYEQRSLTALRDTKEGVSVEEDNKLYDNLTIGKGKVRRRSEAEAQTNEVLVKSRAVNTARREAEVVGTYVSNFEMFDTYEALLEEHGIQKEKQPPPAETGELMKSQNEGKKQIDQSIRIVKLPSFQLASMIIKRLLASNEFEDSQRRFRNMILRHPLDMNVRYDYQLRVLFRYSPRFKDRKRRAVADISICPNNGDIMAVAYGIYSFSAMLVPKSGYVCIWNIKNAGDPERSYFYNVPVVSVEFSPFVPSLVAVGLYDGSVEVRDIMNYNDPPVAVSQRQTSPGCEPVIAIKWIKQNESTDATEIDPFLTLSQDGSVTKFRIINSPYLLGFKQMLLERVEGEPEGLPMKTAKNVDQQANRCPQGLNLTMHPLHQDIYYVLTDEGCLHKCSTNYPHQYLEVLKTHDGSVNCLDFSPWSPKLFLTCGNDWNIRVWIDGIFQPLITLNNQLAPVHCAYWSRTHSTVIVALNRRTLEIWDIRRNLLQPLSSTKLDTSFNTLAVFSKCGNSIAIGNERGNVLLCGLDGMPFPPHFQYEELEKAIYKAVAPCPNLIIELKSIGYFGYPKIKRGGGAGFKSKH